MQFLFSWKGGSWFFLHSIRGLAFFIQLGGGHNFFFGCHYERKLWSRPCRKITSPMTMQNSTRHHLITNAWGRQNYFNEIPLMTSFLGIRRRKRRRCKRRRLPKLAWKVKVILSTTKWLSNFFQAASDAEQL